MGHDHHFLSRLDRVSPEQVELALGLYRDAEMVKKVLERAKLAEGAERVAISMDHPVDGPFIIVARNGHFVTCLGPGMSAGKLQIVTRMELDQIATKVHTLREQLKRARAATPTDGERARLLKLIGRAGHAMTREEFATLALWAPMLWGQILSAYLQNFDVTEKERIDLLTLEGRRDPNDVLESFWKRVFGIGHMIVLGASGDPDPWTEDLGPLLAKDPSTLTIPATTQRIMSIALKGAWAAANVGEPLVASYERALHEAEGFEPGYDAMLGLMAIGIAHEKLREPIRKMFNEGRERWAKGGPALEWRSMVAEMSLSLLDAPNDLSKYALEVGRVYTVEVADRFPEGSPYRYAEMAAVPEEVALLAAVNLYVDWKTELFPLLTFALLPYVAGKPAESLYIPRQLARGLYVPWERGLTLELLERFGRKKMEPMRAEHRDVGRNDPCPCGSGKKYKKCHGQ